MFENVYYLKVLFNIKNECWLRPKREHCWVTRDASSNREGSLVVEFTWKSHKRNLNKNKRTHLPGLAQLDYISYIKFQNHRMY